MGKIFAGARTEIERKAGPKCPSDDQDPISLDRIDEIPEERVIRLEWVVEGQNGRPQTFKKCFDIVSLVNLLKSNSARSRLNPLTRQPWTQSQLKKIIRKAKKLNLVLPAQLILQPLRLTNVRKEIREGPIKWIFDIIEIPINEEEEEIIGGPAMISIIAFFMDRTSAFNRILDLHISKDTLETDSYEEFIIDEDGLVFKWQVSTNKIVIHTTDHENSFKLKLLNSTYCEITIVSENQESMTIAPAEFFHFTKEYYERQRRPLDESVMEIE